MKWLKDNLIYIVITLVLAGGGIWCDYVSQSDSLISKSVTFMQDAKPVTKDVIEFTTRSQVLRMAAVLLYSFSSAIFISIFVTTVLERNKVADEQRQIDELRKAVNTDVFMAVFRKLMPEEIFDAVKRSIIGVKLVRRNMRWIFDFSVQGDVVEVKQTIIYDLANQGNETLDDPIIATISKDFKEDRLTHCSCELEGQQLAKYHEGATDNHGVIAEDISDERRQITIKAGIPAKKSAQFTFVYALRRPIAHVEDTYFSKYPIINGQIIANFPPEFDFSIWLSADATCKTKLDERGRKIIDIIGCILPHQGYCYRLIRKK